MILNIQIYALDTKIFSHTTKNPRELLIITVLKKPQNKS